MITFIQFLMNIRFVVFDSSAPTHIDERKSRLFNTALDLQDSVLRSRA